MYHAGSHQSMQICISSIDEPKRGSRLDGSLGRAAFSLPTDE
jgi:hypothetical protein